MELLHRIFCRLGLPYSCVALLDRSATHAQRDPDLIATQRRIRELEMRAAELELIDLEIDVAARRRRDARIERIERTARDAHDALDRRKGNE